jgi:hypothetical protein
MNVERKINDCEYNLEQIKHFNPDPFYVKHFLIDFIQGIIDFYDGILDEANKDFGLFMSGRCTVENFESRCKEKNDEIALKFLSWFKENYQNEHNSSYPKFINNLITLINENDHFPKIFIKMLVDQRYNDDYLQEIKVRLKNGKLKSKEELQIEIERNIPIFLKIINKKRKNSNEPKVLENQVIASTFIEISNLGEFEIPYSCEIYIPVMKRILVESRKKIKNSIIW